MSQAERFPAGGPREPVYAFLRSHGFVMSKRSDKEWTWGDKTTLLLYGAGSQATIYSDKGNWKAPLADAVEAFIAKAMS
mgnify:CR=1 FL=1